jgi:two-component system OmpR family sensor kinase
MSSSPPSRSRRAKRFAGWSLRTRLVAGILALLAAVCLAFGVVSAFVVTRTLTDQLDHQLVSAANRAIPPGGRTPGRGPALFPQGQGAGTLTAHIVGSDIDQAAVLQSGSGELLVLGGEQASPLLSVPVDGNPHTVTIASLGDYRVVANPLPDGDVVVTGLPLQPVRDTVYHLVLTEAIVAGTALILAGVAGAFLVRVSLRPLRRVVTTARRVALLPLAQGEVDLSVRVPDADTDPRTEVGQVGAALNRMLGHIGTALQVRQASETRVRQFVADASHELRTPLAAIRGYAELTRRGGETVPTDVAHALGRIESESQRMTALVDDLLLLARLDSGRPVDTDPVELSRLVVDTVNDAHAAGPEHRWLLDVPDEPVTVPGDTARLHQVLANLLANARTHTPPGSTVTTSLSTTSDGSATIAVTDNGPGIPDTVLPDIFERFARGDTSRSRAAGSTGLGLAIVAAVVDAHHGDVAVTSEPGRTSFVVHLPGAAR